MNNKIAILLDTGCTLDERHFDENVFYLPLHINFKDRSYTDDEISPKKLYEMMKSEIPKTSISSLGEIKEKIQSIANKGYDKILSISISSGLSGVFNAVKMVSQELHEVEIKMVDSKNISLGTGFLALYAQKLLRENPDIQLEELYQKVNDTVPKSRVFFSMETLEYLVAGGRIGKVMGGLGSLLKIKPIISCNKEGIYYTIKKVRSTDKALAEIIKLVKEHISEHKEYFIALIYRDDKNILERMEEQLSTEIKKAIGYIAVDLVSPALGVHTGDSLIGVGVCPID